ncbi:MAG: glycerol kinase GlpK [Sphaerochaetaceae bacterium]|nr:glycerol kinase GlpK [Sphaerochaetaceae bacterium]
MKESKLFFLTIDQGTSGTKAIIFTSDGKLLSRHDEGHHQFYPNPGWVEHDPDEIYDNTLKAIRAVLKTTGISAQQIICISISNQRETTLMWNKVTGKPVMNAVVWQCQRGMEICNTLEREGKAPVVKEKTGLVLSPYFSAAKARWIMDHRVENDTSVRREDMLFGTMDSYLIWRLTGGKVHATEYSNASRTQLYNIHSLAWDEELLEMFHLDSSMMPKVLPSNSVFGETAPGLFDTPLFIAGVLGDSHAAFFAQNCFSTGMAKVTYGTGSSVMMNIGTKPVESDSVVTSIGYSIDDEIMYVLEGNINPTGATIKWLIDDVELFDSPREVSTLASSVPDTQGVYLVPALTGLSAPHWNSEVRGVLTHLSRGTKKAHIARAAEESIVYQIIDVITAMREESGITLRELRVDGGPTRDDFLMQFQSDMGDVPVVRTTIEELSATGAMYMGALACGIWEKLSDIVALREEQKRFSCTMTVDRREMNYDGWKKAVRNLLQSEL